MEQLRKIGVIIANELRTLLVDRNALLIMLAAPLALASIIGLAFGGFASGDVGFDPIPIAVVNMDQPIAAGGQTFALGEQFVKLLAPPADATAAELAENELWGIVRATVMTDSVAARARVESGELVAALILPPDFSSGTVASFGDPAASQPMTAHLYTDPASGDLAGIVESVVNSIGSQFATGNAAVSSAIRGALLQTESPELTAGMLSLVTGEQDLLNSDLFEEVFAQGVSLPISRETASGQQATFNPFVMFGSSQAIFFMLFTAMATSAEFLRDKRNGILRRLLASPTPISTIVLGKIGAAAVTCAAQVTVLLAALTLINAVFAREFSMIFGTNVLGILAVVAAVSLAAAGLAMAVAAFARTPEQAQAITGVIAITMGLVGGAFFNVQAAGVMATLSRLTVNFWAVDAISRLAQGDNAIWLNLGVLLAIAAVTLTLAFTRFNRTLEA